MSRTSHTTRRMAYLAILTAISYLLMYIQFPLIPGADFLQFDFSVLPVLLALALFDTRSAFAVLTLRTILRLILNNGGIGSLIGLPMNYLTLGVFVLALALIWKKQQTLSSYVLASCLGTLAFTGLMLILNLIYAVPLYAKFANFDIKAILGLSNYLFAMVLPFNLIEGLIFAVTFYIFYLAIKPIIAKL